MFASFPMPSPFLCSLALLREPSSWRLSLLLSLFFLIAQSAIAQPSALFDSGPGLQVERAGTAAPEDVPLQILRSRGISLNSQAISSLRKLPQGDTLRQSAAPAEVLLNLFPDTAFELQVLRTQPTHDGLGTLWMGSVRAAGRADAGGECILTFYQGALAGFVRLDSGEYYRIMAEPFAGGEVRQVRFRGYPAGAIDYVIPGTADENGVVRDPLQAQTVASEAAAKRAPSWAPDMVRTSGGGSELGVLVAFSQRAGNMSELLMQAFASNMIAEANANFQRSQVQITLLLKMVTKVELATSDYGAWGIGAWSGALNALTSTSDGHLDEIHTLRDTYGADLVTLLIKPTLTSGFNVVGIANLLNSNPASFASNAFSLVHADFANGPSYTFSHEVGHNLGLVHDDANSGGAQGLHPYSKGYQQKDLAPNFFTIMAYSNGCDGCQGLPNYSNPNVSHSGIPTGIPDQVDAARTLNFVRTFAAEWRGPGLPLPCVYDITSGINAGHDAFETQISVGTTQNCTWTATAQSPWITILQGQSGSGSGQVKISVTKNDTFEIRTGTILIAGKPVSISQYPEPCRLEVTPSYLSIGSASALLEINVIALSPCKHTTTTRASWLSIASEPVQINSATVKVNVAANPSGLARQSSVRIQYTDVTIQQNALPAPCKASWPATTLNVPAGITEHTFNVTADPGCRWEVDRNGTNFLSYLQQPSGFGNGTVRFRVEMNPLTQVRTGTLLLDGQPLTIVQEGKPVFCPYNLSPPQIDAPHTGGDFKVEMSTLAGCYWEVNGRPSWITRQPPYTNEGPASIDLRIAANPTSFARTATIQSGTATLTVNQAGVPPPTNCVYTLSADKVNFGFRESTVDLGLTVNPASCPWVLDSTLSWLSAPFTSGTGNASLRLRASTNSSILTRNGTVRLGGKVIRVEQESMPTAMLLWPSPQVVFAEVFDRSTPRKATVELRAGPAVLPLRATIAGASWLKESIAATRTQTPFELEMNPLGLPAGVHKASVNVAHTAGSVEPAQIPVVLQVLAKAGLAISARSLSFQAKRGSQPPAQKIVIHKLGTKPTATATTFGGNWLRVDVMEQSGGWRVEAQPVSGDFPVGLYDAVIEISCGVGCQGSAIPVRYRVEDATSAGNDAAPALSSGGIVNAASFAPGIAGGAWASIFGQRLAPTTRLWQEGDFSADLLPTTLDGVRVSVNGRPAAISFISPQQVNFQAPDGLEPGWVLVELETSAGKDSAWVRAHSHAPALFLFGEDLQPAAIHPDGVPAWKPKDGSATARPAKSHGMISIFGTGFGPTSPSVPSGRLFSGAAPLAGLEHVEVQIGRHIVPVEFIGLSAAGLNQINVRIPDVTTGKYPLEVRIHGTSVQTGIEIELER